MPSQKDTSSSLRAEADSDYRLDENAKSCWITVNDVSVWVRRTEEGVEVQLFPAHREMQPPLDMAFVSHEDAAAIKKRWPVDTSHIGA